jgi:hypothetical protein
VCCQPPDAASDVDRVILIPFCDASGKDALLNIQQTCSGCQMNAVLTGSMNTKLTCTDTKTFAFTAQYDAAGNFDPMNMGTYFNADSVSCNGCAAIMDDMCIGPRWVLSGWL